MPQRAGSSPSLEVSWSRTAGSRASRLIWAIWEWALIGMFYGYPFLESLFESTSAAANVGLSCGITAPSMPAALKMTYIFQMWAGRLEFMSVFTLIGFFVAAIKGK